MTRRDTSWTQQLITSQTRAGAFDTVAQADRAIRRLLDAGFSKDQLAVVCPARFKDHFLPSAPNVETPSDEPGGASAMGGAVGATLGGLTLAATVVTGGGAGLTGVDVFIGGGAIAGGFANLVAKGYEPEADDFYRQAIERGKIVVGVAIDDDVSARQFADAQRILAEAGTKPFVPV